MLWKDKGGVIPGFQHVQIQEKLKGWVWLEQRQITVRHEEQEADQNPELEHGEEPKEDHDEDLKEDPKEDGVFHVKTTPRSGHRKRPGTEVVDLS